MIRLPIKTLRAATLLLAINMVIGAANVLAGAATRIQMVEAVPVTTGIMQQLTATATASSTGGAGGPALAVDGSLSTRWESQFNIDPTTLTLDLGTAQSINQVIIHWETANAATYNVEGSNDGSNWDVLYSFTGGTFAERTDTLTVSGSYRYVRMNGLTRPAANVYGYSIYEMEVYGFVALISDSDNDGVDDSVDSCPGTLANTPVEINGCDIGVIGGYESPTSYPGYNLVWSDEFNGNSLNLSDWTHEIGTGCPSLCGWGNNELEYYRAENTAVADGALTIEAKEENFGGRSYTSSRIKTESKQTFQYGRIDVRAVLPQGQGIWPAIWMLGQSISSIGWPHAGEIDIMELVGNNDDTILGTVHWQAGGGYAYNGDNVTLPSGSFADEYHVFSIVWDSSSISWYLDDSAIPFHTFSITQPDRSEFKAPFFFLLNIAVGGNLPGAPDGSTVFPQKMIIDYVRVFSTSVNNVAKRLKRLQ